MIVMRDIISHLRPCAADQFISCKSAHEATSTACFFFRVWQTSSGYETRDTIKIRVSIIFRMMIACGRCWAPQSPSLTCSDQTECGVDSSSMRYWINVGDFMQISEKRKRQNSGWTNQCAWWYLWNISSSCLRMSRACVRFAEWECEQILKLFSLRTCVRFTF